MASVLVNITGDFRILQGSSQPMFGNFSWVSSGFVALSMAVALAGFCVGCFLLFHFTMERIRSRSGPLAGMCYTSSAVDQSER